MQISAFIDRHRLWSLIEGRCEGARIFLSPLNADDYQSIDLISDPIHFLDQHEVRGQRLFIHMGSGRPRDIKDSGFPYRILESKYIIEIELPTISDNGMSMCIIRPLSKKSECVKIYQALRRDFNSTLKKGLYAGDRLDKGIYYDDDASHKFIVVPGEWEYTKSPNKSIQKGRPNGRP